VVHVVAADDLRDDVDCVQYGFFCRYHTQLCQIGAQCSRPICFFAHSSAELREPTWGTYLPQDVLATARLAVSAEVARQNMVGHGCCLNNKSVN